MGRRREARRPAPSCPDPASPWFDDVTTVERKETRDDIFLIAAQDAEIYLQREYGGVSRRNWADLHAARFSHPLGSIAFPFAWLFNRGPVPLEGDGTTVMRVSWNRLNPFQAWEYRRGASSSTSVSGIPPACRCRRANPAIR